MNIWMNNDMIDDSRSGWEIYEFNMSRMICKIRMIFVKRGEFIKSDVNGEVFEMICDVGEKGEGVDKKDNVIYKNKKYSMICTCSIWRMEMEDRMEMMSEDKVIETRMRLT